MARCREGWQRRVKRSARTFLGIDESESQRFLKCRIFAKFRPEKYDFDLCLVEKMAKIDRSRERQFQNRQFFSISFQLGAKNIETFSFFPLLSYVVCSQICSD
jgi:hypothetical protein